MNQHTPGPWMIKRDEEYPGSIPNHVIYSVRHVVARLMHDETSNAEANARLIAAAPEMLKALKMADIVITHGYSSDRDRKDCRDYIREIFARIEGRERADRGEGVGT